MDIYMYKYIHKYIYTYTSYKSEYEYIKDLPPPKQTEVSYSYAQSSS